MRKPALFAAVVCLISCYGMNAFGASAVPRYLGASTLFTNGANAGQTGMNQACRTTYGVTAHMCRADEFFSSAGTGKITAYNCGSNPLLATACPMGPRLRVRKAGRLTLVPESNLFLHVRRVDLVFGATRHLRAVRNRNGLDAEPSRIAARRTGSRAVFSNLLALYPPVNPGQIRNLSGKIGGQLFGGDSPFPVAECDRGRVHARLGPKLEKVLHRDYHG